MIDKEIVYGFSPLIHMTIIRKCLHPIATIPILLTLIDDSKFTPFDTKLLMKYFDQDLNMLLSEAALLTNDRIISYFLIMQHE
jgi:hypothetical protein